MAWLSRNPNFCAFLCKHWVNVLAVYILSLFSFKFHQHFASNNFLFVTKYLNCNCTEKLDFRKKNAIHKMSIDEIDTKLLLSRLSSKPGEISRTNGIDREGEVGPLFYCVHQSRQQVKSLTEQFFSKEVSRNLNFLKVFCESYERVGFRNHGNISCRGGPEGLKKYFIIKDLT